MYYMYVNNEFSDRCVLFFLGNALEDLTLDDFPSLAAIEKEIDNDTNSVSSTLSAGFSSNNYTGKQKNSKIPNSVAFHHY